MIINIYNAAAEQLTMEDNTKTKIRDQVAQKVLTLLTMNPTGLSFSDIRRSILSEDPSLNGNTLNVSIWSFVTDPTNNILKPSRGFYKLSNVETDVAQTQECTKPDQTQNKEENFYEPFATWLVRDVEEATKAISLGGKKFQDKWGTPDVIGKYSSSPRDIIKMSTEIISAEIKTETNEVITAFGQSCAYKLFSHKVYLVVPNQSKQEDISRLDSLCQIVGIGLVTFDAMNPQNPEFRIHVRPAKHEPDLFYTNKYLSIIESELFRDC